MSKPIINEIAESEQVRKEPVELVIKKEAPQENYTEIDLMNVFANMGKTRRIYLRLMALFLVIGICLPLLLFQFQSSSRSATALLSFNYKGAMDHLAPDGSTLDINIIKSSYIVNQAVAGMDLPDDIDIEELKNSIVITEVLPEETMQQAEVLKTMSEKMSTNSEVYKSILAMDTDGGNRYIIRMTNSQNLSSSRLTQLLNRILENYKLYFTTLYADSKLPENSLDSIDLDNLDYLESLDIINDSMKGLLSYCNSKAKNYPDYRSGSDGMSFADLASRIKTLKEVSYDYLYSYVYYSGIAKDSQAMATKYNYNLRNLQYELEEVDSNIESVGQILESYENDKILVSGENSESSRMTSATTDYYNKLITKQMEQYKDRSDVMRKISDYENRIQNLNTNTSGSAKKSAAEEIQDLYIACTNAYTMIADHAKEFITGDVFSNAYMNFTNAQMPAEASFTSVGNIKKMGIGAAAGLFAAFVIWGINALVMELRKEDER